MHVAFGRDEAGRRLVARGIVAVGQFGVGLVTIAQFGVGVLIGVGQVSVGLVCVSQVAISVIFGLGQLAVGAMAIGQLAIGVYVLAQVGFGQFVWSMDRHDPEVLQMLRAVLEWSRGAR